MLFTFVLSNFKDFTKSYSCYAYSALYPEILKLTGLGFSFQQAGKFPKFVSKEMEAMYIEELKSSVNQLMANLESMPVSKGGEFKLQKLKRGHNTSIIDMGQEDENQLSKSDVVLSFTLEVQDDDIVKALQCISQA